MSSFIPLSKQTIMSDYMFATVMREPKRIKPLIEMILGKKIRTIRVIENEKTIKERYKSKGIRLDLYVEDCDGIIYDVEVQTTDQQNLPRRMRYYQALLDIAFFRRGIDYKHMRKAYVIFICNFDPFGKGRYIYTFETRCKEDLDLRLDDDAVKVVVNTKGTVGDISPELKEALLYFDHQEITGEYSQELDDAVEAVKESEERQLEYMTLMTTIAEAQAIAQDAKLVALVRGWYDDKDRLPADLQARALQIPIPVFNNIVSMIEEHPDWDDEKVAYETDWEAE